MIFFKIFFAFIGIFGLCFIWAVLGFFHLAMNHERIESSYFACIKKLFILGPIYIIMWAYGYKLKKEKRSMKF